jgi:peptide-methionine (R)-S-oxide reductase
MVRAAFVLMISLGAAGCVDSKPVPPPKLEADVNGKIVKTDDEWRKLLTRAQFHVLREKGTELAFSGAYYNAHEKATYVCAACGLELFSSEAKFDSGTGWPSFTQPIAEGRVDTAEDTSLGISRNEVRCARCGGHLGHVFDDGPKPTGMRYCINSVALYQEKK